MQGMETPYAENPSLWLSSKHPTSAKLYQLKRVVVIWSFPSSACLPRGFSFFSLLESLAAKSDVLLPDPGSRVIA